MSEIKTRPKKLVDLRPKWLSDSNNPGSEKWGIEFDCPCGTPPATCDCGQPDCPAIDSPGCQFSRVSIMFSNPVNGPVSRWGREKWKRKGETFEDLSLVPSINAVGHWHGWLTNGELVSC